MMRPLEPQIRTSLQLRLRSLRAAIPPHASHRYARPSSHSLRDHAFRAAGDSATKRGRALAARSLLFAASLALLLGAPAAGGPGDWDRDGDGIPDPQDNCVLDANSSQDDTDGDFCGNLCDADYNQSGLVTIADFGEFAQKFGGVDQEFCHVQPIPGCVVSVDDFGFYATNFGTVPGPSGTTPGTVACP